MNYPNLNSPPSPNLSSNALSILTTLLDKLAPDLSGLVQIVAAQNHSQVCNSKAVKTQKLIGI
jgi:hypothetical protein